VNRERDARDCPRWEVTQMDFMAQLVNALWSVIVADVKLWG
jgi:hypothetical protein